MCVLTSVGRELLLNIITLQGIGFLDTLTHLVYFIIVPDGLFVSRIHCLLITFLSCFFHDYFNQIAHTASIWSRFITVLNGIVE